MGSQLSYKKSIFDLAAKGYQQEVISLLESGFPNDQKSPSGYTLSRLSLELGLHHLFKYLIETSCPLIPSLPTGSSVLHRSVELGHSKLTQTIIKNPKVFGNLKNSIDSLGRTPLHIAVIQESPEMVALLLKFNADTNLLDSCEKSPIDYALEKKSPEIDEIIDQFSIQDCMVPKHDDEEATRWTPPHTFERALIDSKVPIVKDIEFGQQINRGSSSVVFRGKWRGSDVAIKQFRQEYSSNPKALNKFVKEMQVLAHVRHPNLLLLMGIVIDQPQLCLVTELVDNCSLFQAIHKKKLNIDLPSRLHISVQIARALVYLHTNNPPIVHRDLKPENCLIDFNLNVKIADFGLSRPLSSFECKEGLLMTTVCVGTTRFMAPELFDTEMMDDIGTEVDIWAFGCVLIELFSNKRPWHHISGADAQCIFHEIFHNKTVPIPDCICPEVKDIIQECCRYNPRQRPKIQAVLKKLEAAQRAIHKFAKESLLAVHSAEGSVKEALGTRINIAKSIEKLPTLSGVIGKEQDLKEKAAKIKENQELIGKLKKEKEGRKKKTIQEEEKRLQNLLSKRESSEGNIQINRENRQKQIQERAQWRKNQLLKAKETDADLFIAKSTVPLYQKIEERYQYEKIFPDLERKKDELYKRRILHKLESLESLRKHAQKHQEMINLMRKTPEPIVTKYYPVSSFRQILLDEEKEKIARDIEIENQKVKLLSKRKIYSKYVKEMFQPIVQKRQEIKEVVTPFKRSHSVHNNTQIKKRKWKKNTMVFSPPSKPEPKFFDYLGEKRKSRANQVKRSYITNFEDVKDLNVDKKHQFAVILDKQSAIEERKMNGMPPSNPKGFRQNLKLNDMIINSIKAKLSILKTIQSNY